ncbi:MAG: mechanosensitive ion channel family protein, partial [Candidatus Nanohaloarchaea archaeon]|nr:mechanosensitive ion channel family protein [Candidatus Nanohaloarchaea archaeon]
MATMFGLPAVPSWSLGLLKVVAAVVGGYLAGRFVVRPLVYHLLRRRSEHIARPGSRFFMYVTVLVALIAGLSAGGYSSTLGVVGAIAAAGTFALGFGMQDTLKAILAGVFIFIDRPFEIGDWIEWGDHEGKVEDIQLRTTRVKTFDNELLTVPNDQIANATITNNTANDRLRLRTTIGIGYEDDIEKAKYITRTVLDNMDEVLDDPGPEVVLDSLGDSAVN